MLFRSGTGSGYQAAILAHLADRVYTVEINPTLAKKAGDFLSQLGYERIEVKCGDGFFGWPSEKSRAGWRPKTSPSSALCR